MSTTLDREQKQAVTACDRSIFLTAGAGAGKTRVLTERVKYILTRSDERVLAMTFTNRAAEEMAARIESALPEIEPGRVAVQTIDGFCRHLLTVYDIEAHTMEAMEQLNEGEAAYLLEQCFDEAAPALFKDPVLLQLLEETETSPEGFKRQLTERYDDYRTRGVLFELRKKPRDVSAGAVIEAYLAFLEELKAEIGSGRSKLHAFLKDADVDAVRARNEDERIRYLEGVPAAKNLKSMTKERERALNEHRMRLDLLKESRNAPYVDAIARAFETLHEVYAAAKAERGVVDFQDLLEKATALLEEGRVDVGGYDHILVDEFQDTNPLQIRFLNALKKESTLFVVGDKKQSIYGFRGADTDVSDVFRREMEEAGAESMALINNYRSHRELVRVVADLFNDLFEGEDVVGHGEGEWAFRGVDVGEVEGEAIEDSIRREALWIARDIRKHPSKSRALLLWRRRYMSVYEEVFRACGVTYKNLSSDGFFEAREVRDLLIALAAHAEGRFSHALLRSPFIGWSQEELYLFDAGGDVGESARERYDAFRDFLRARRGVHSPYVFLQELIEETGYRHDVASRRGRQGIANVDKLLSMASDYDKAGCHIEGFLDEMEEKRRLETVGEATFGGEADIEILTMHGAKGLEYETVYLGHLFASERADGGLWNYSREYGMGIRREEARGAYDVNRALDAEKREAESLRLLYVAMTRAEKYLYLLKSRGKASGLMRYLEDVAFEEEDVDVLPTTSTTSPAAARPKERAPLEVQERRVVSASRLIGGFSPAERVGGGSAPRENYLAFGTLFHDYAERAKGPDDALKVLLLKRAEEYAVDTARLKEAMDRYDETFGVGEILATEVPFSADLGGLVLEGFYDQIRRIDGAIAIVDFKTGRRGLASPALPSYRLQLGLYGRAYRAIKKQEPALYLWTAADGAWTRIALDAEEERTLDKLLKHAAGDK
ncbi:MAG: UvrD-helicase domain-containing protein [Peptoniphilus sp.]|nr:UvrD-helicase domain-containing protein [Peptoniphilus sp.]MDD7363639.1 UvrD-helicase domain-containing protein [Bacillota bacterium]MDY6044715.1 UvrD-helicase domain-containing protein [Peptoniphilus sp.]